MGTLGKVSSFAKSLWNDPFRWQLVKSFTAFGVAVYFSWEFAAAAAAEAAEQASS